MTATIYNTHGKTLATVPSEQAIDRAKSIVRDYGEMIFIENGQTKTTVYPDRSTSDGWAKMAARNVAVQALRAFRHLPSEALPSATCVDQLDRDNGMDAWYGVQNPHDWLNGPILLRADRDEWRGGVIVDVVANTVRPA